MPDGNPVTLAEAVSAIVLSAPSIGAHDAGAPSPAAKPSYEATDADIEEVEGAWYDPLTFDVRTVQRDGGRIVLRYALETGGRAIAFASDARRSFLSSDGTTHYRFQPASATSAARLVRSFADDPETAFVRFEPAKLDAAKLSEYAGRYRSDEVAREVELSVVDGKLQMGTWGHAPDSDPISVLGRDIFRMGDGGFQFERDAHGRIRGFLASSYGYHGVRFVKSSQGPTRP